MGAISFVGLISRWRLLGGPMSAEITDAKETSFVDSETKQQH